MFTRAVLGIIAAMLFSFAVKLLLAICLAGPELFNAYIYKFLWLVGSNVKALSSVSLGFWGGYLMFPDLF